MAKVKTNNDAPRIDSNTIKIVPCSKQVQMPVTIKSIYENGKISLTEPAPTDENVPVSVVFPQDEEIENRMSGKYKIRWGSLAGKINIPYNFNDELEDFKEYR